MRGFSIINIIIIMGLILLAYLGYAQYLDNKVEKILKNSESPSKFVTSENPQTATTTNSITIEKNSSTTTQATSKILTTEKITETTKTGFYKNNTYFYQISFPENWPIKIQAASNVSLGTVPPKNGQGAITIEVTQGQSNEINQAKAEAKKYPEIISLTEEFITLSGVNGNKITITNLITKNKTINILLNKLNYNYIIKYSEESAEFVKQVNQALATFKFLK